MDKNSFGELIKVLRKKNNLTQADLARKLNISTDLVSKWELGKSKPNWDMQELLCKIFDLSHDDLHNPETVIARIGQTCVEEASDEQEKPVEEENSFATLKLHPASKKKKIIIFLTTLLLLILIIAGIVLFLQKHNATDTLNPENPQVADGFAYYYHDSRYCFDDFAGEEIYERSCVYFGTLSADTINQLQDTASEEWRQDNNVRQDIKILKLSFYQNEEEADTWKSTKDCIYLFRE